MIDQPLNAKIWAIAWPAILANISIPLLGLVDAALLGHLDSATHLAAVAIGGAVLSFLYWGFGFLRMGTTGEVARAVGAKDDEGALLALGRAAVLAVVIAALLLVFQQPLVSAGLLIMGPEDQIELIADRYTHIRLASAPAVLLTYCAVGWFIGHQNTRWPLSIVVITNLLNIALDAWFIVGLGMASEGAALATVIAEYVGVVVAGTAVYLQVRAQLKPGLWRAFGKLGEYASMLKSNLHLFLRTLTLLFAFAFFTAMGENFGASVLSANAILIQLLMFSAYALDGFAYAAEGLSGEALGARNLERFSAVYRRCAVWTLGAALLISLFLGLSPPLLFPLLTSLPDVLSAMFGQTVWLALMPLAAAGSYLYDGIFIGAGKTRAMLINMVVSAFGVYLPLWYLTQEWDNGGLWFAFVAFHVSRSVGMGLYFRGFNHRQSWLSGPLT